MRCDNILQAIGKTPLIRLNRIAQGVPAQVYAKADNLNPGGSVKDRIAGYMIEEAEQRGLLKPGGTIVEATSGNTGLGLAVLAAVKGYKAIFTINDKQSQEKMDALRAMGAEVIVCPTAVEPEDPRSYYSVAKKLAREIPNSYYPDQYQNPQNPQSHYETTGPEIWEDSEGKITHFVAGMGTGGTITGVGKYLKKKNPAIRIIGVDPIGSLYYEKVKHGRVGKAAPYVVEGIGEDFFPRTMDLDILDDVYRVSDGECFIWARKLARMEGIFAGGSAGGAVSVALQVARKLGAKDMVVTFLPDSGDRYLSKIYNDDWMRRHQYWETELHVTAGDVVRLKHQRHPGSRLMIASASDTAQQALMLMQNREISQLPVFENHSCIGTVREDEILNLALRGADLKSLVLRECMRDPLPVLGTQDPIERLTFLLTNQNPAVLVQLSESEYEILTKYDLIAMIATLTEQTASHRKPAPGINTDTPD
ncbi:MAG: pyridoxal-phosphate dependent enzyme [Acidobacteria bacterium]|nr:pyridoxal-phosphate dependent enzyme [Acidobacteriota bacterium]